MSINQLPPVETVGFYSRDSQFNLYESAPTKLNTKGEVAITEPAKSSLINEKITADDNEDEPVHENYMQSFLWYIFSVIGSIRGSQETSKDKNNQGLLDGVEFVTIRQVLATVAEKEECNRIMAFRNYGIIWIVWYEQPKDDDKQKGPKDDLARGRAFAKAIVDENEASTGFQKTVNKVTLTLPGGPNATVLYSAETDAWRRDKDESVEIKSTTFPFEKFLKLRSQYYFWQSYFGNVKAIIVGQLKKITKDKSVYSIVHLCSHTPKSLLEAVQKYWFKWSVEKGMPRVSVLLKDLRDLLNKEGDKMVLKQEWINGAAQWVEDTEAEFDQEFIEHLDAARGAHIK